MRFGTSDTGLPYANLVAFLLALTLRKEIFISRISAILPATSVTAVTKKIGFFINMSAIFVFWYLEMIELFNKLWDLS